MRARPPTTLPRDNENAVLIPAAQLRQEIEQIAEAKSVDANEEIQGLAQELAKQNQETATPTATSAHAHLCLSDSR